MLVAAEGTGSVEAGKVLPLLGLVIAGYGLGAVAFRRLDRERFFTLVLALVAVHRPGERGGRAGVVQALL